MNYSEIKDNHFDDYAESDIRKLFTANGFELDEESDYSDEQVSLLLMYDEYTKALADAKEVRLAFRYQDGEEMVDKSKVFDSYRRYANDLYNRWKSALDDYNRSHRTGSGFILRKRASWLDVQSR